MKEIFKTVSKYIKTDDNILVINKCSKCRCGFTFTKDDIERDRDGRYVACPNCGAFIDARCAQRNIEFKDNECGVCAIGNPERAKLCDEAKADTMCEAFRRWYKENYE